MKNIFESEKIIDANGNEHEVFTRYFLNGTMYVITKDKNILIRNGDKYEEVSIETKQLVLEDITQRHQKKDVIEYEERGEI